MPVRRAKLSRQGFNLFGAHSPKHYPKSPGLSSISGPRLHKYKLRARRFRAITQKDYEEMLTVKHVRFDGAETIDHAERVIFYPDLTQAAAAPHLSGTVTAVGAISGSVDWYSGIVYVMNENGSTVSKYDLGRHPADDALGVGAAGVRAS